MPRMRRREPPGGDHLSIACSFWSAQDHTARLVSIHIHALYMQMIDFISKST